MCSHLSVVLIYVGVFNMMSLFQIHTQSSIVLFSLEMTSISTYKMVIWRDDSIPISLGSYLVTGYKRDSSSTLSTFRDWKPGGMREEGTSVNVFEVTGDTVGFTEGIIYILFIVKCRLRHDGWLS